MRIEERNRKSERNQKREQKVMPLKRSNRKKISGKSVTDKYNNKHGIKLVS